MELEPEHQKIFRLRVPDGKKKKLFREKAFLKLIKKENLAEVYVYKRLLYERKIYTSKIYSKSYIRKDCMIMLSDGCCIEINEILKHDNEVFTFFYMHKKKVLDSRKFSTDLHVLRCPEHELTIFRKCLSVCLYYFVDTVSQELIAGN